MLEWSKYSESSKTANIKSAEDPLFSTFLLFAFRIVNLPTPSRFSERAFSRSRCQAVYRDIFTPVFL